jgi:hypothetical protein
MVVVGVVVEIVVVVFVLFAAAAVVVMDTDLVCPNTQSMCAKSLLRFKMSRKKKV